MPNYALIMYMPEGPEPSRGGDQGRAPALEPALRRDDGGGRARLEQRAAAGGLGNDLRVRDGETLISDGPFAETKEILGGFFVLDVPDLDEALKWAARIPSAERGSVEVRPVWG